jgi:hypothetical protein
MRVYLGKDSHSATDDMTETHETVRHLTAELKAYDTKYLWTIYFHLQDFLMTWTDVK